VNPLERSALILGDEPDRVDRLVSPLRRANLSVRRAQLASEAERIVQQTPLDLIIVALPVPGADRVVQGLRALGCASRCAGLVVVGSSDGDEPYDRAIGRFANRLLPTDCSELEFRQAVATLLEVAPRIDVPAGAQVRLTLADGRERRLRLENLSISGMLMRTSDPLAVGTVFGFALELPNEPEPIRGRAEVVRLSPRNPDGRCGVAARFRALGGEAPQRLERLVFRTRGRAPTAAAEARSASGSHPRPRTIEATPQIDPEEVESSRRELAELNPVLDEMLEVGLLKRLVVADWYVTGAELGLESLRAFSTILSSVYEDRAISAEAERRLADLVEVRGQLAEFGRPQQDVPTRVRVLVALRPALERLLRELAETGAAVGTGLAAARFPGVVSQTVVEIQRLVAARRSLTHLAAQLVALSRPRWLFGRGGGQRSASQLVADFGALAATFGTPLTVDKLRNSRRRRQAAQHVARATRDLERRLANIHRKAFSLRFRRLATDDVEADLQDPKLHRVLLETLAAGSEYLARAYSAYRHALEVIDGDPELIDRVERLGATVSLAETVENLAPPARRAPSGAVQVGKSSS
jgi:hypothetical protein